MKRHPDPGPGQSIGIDQDKTACMDAETFFFLSLLPSLPLSLFVFLSVRPPPQMIDVCSPLACLLSHSARPNGSPSAKPRGR